jgi:hypothetical protein
MSRRNSPQNNGPGVDVDMDRLAEDIGAPEATAEPSHNEVVVSQQSSQAGALSAEAIRAVCETSARQIEESAAMVFSIGESLKSEASILADAIRRSGEKHAAMVQRFTGLVNACTAVMASERARFATFWDETHP